MKIFPPQTGLLDEIILQRMKVSAKKKLALFVKLNNVDRWDKDL
jgi:hypothetical protein